MYQLSTYNVGLTRYHLIYFGQYIICNRLSQDFSLLSGHRRRGGSHSVRNHALQPRPKFSSLCRNDVESAGVALAADV